MNEIRFFIDILFDVKLIRASSSRYESLYLLRQNFLKKHKDIQQILKTSMAVRVFQLVVVVFSRLMLTNVSSALKTFVLFSGKSFE